MSGDIINLSLPIAQALATSAYRKLKGHDLQARYEHLKAHQSLPQPGLLEQIPIRLVSKTMGMLQWGTGYLWSKASSVLERKAFFEQGRLLLQNTASDSTAVAKWSADAQARFPDLATASILDHCKNPQNLNEEALSNLRYLIMAEQGIPPESFPIPENHQQIISIAQTVLPTVFQAPLLAILPAVLPSKPTAEDSLELEEISKEQPAPSRDYLDELESLLNRPASKFLARFVLPILQGALLKIRELNANNPQVLPLLDEVENNIRAVEKSLLESEEVFLRAFDALKKTIRNLPPLSVHGFKIYDGPSIESTAVALPNPISSLTETIEPTLEEARAKTDIAAKKFEETSIQYLTHELMSFFVGQTDCPENHLRSVTRIAEEIEPIPSTPSKASFIKAVCRKIRQDTTIPWIKRRFFSLYPVVSFAYWFCGQLTTKSIRQMISYLRNSIEEIKVQKGSTLNPNMFLVKVLNGALHNNLEIFKHIGLSKPGDLRAGSLKEIIQETSKDPRFFEGMSDNELYSKVADQLAELFIPKIVWPKPLNWLTFVPNKILAWGSRKILKEINFVPKMVAKIQPRHNKPTQIELKIYSILREKLFSIYKKIQDRSESESTTTQVRSDCVQDLKELCYNLNKVRRVQGLGSVDEIRRYAETKPLMEKGEELLIDLNEKTLGNLLMNIYKAVLEDVSLETQLESLLCSVANSLEDPISSSNDQLQADINYEKDLIEQLMKEILQTSVSQGIDAAIESNQPTVKSSEQIQKIVSLEGIREKLTDLDKATDPSIRKTHAIQLRNQLIATDQHIEIFINKIGMDESLSRTDRHQYLVHLSNIRSALDAAHLLSRNVMDGTILDRSKAAPPSSLVKMAEDLKGQLSELRISVVDQATIRPEHIETLRRRFKNFSNLFSHAEGTINELSNGRELLSQLKGCQVEFIKNFKLLQENPSIEVAKNLPLQELNNLIRKLKESADQSAEIALKKTLRENIQKLSALFAQNSPLDDLIKQPVESKVVDIQWMQKDSTLVKIGKQQTAAAINKYLDGLFPILSDPVAYDVAIRTALLRFVR
ncbi:MAG: hypothetical protein ACOYK9_01075 [Chlamydiia bacterium]